MTELAHVAIHSSQFPDSVQGSLLQSLRDRKINHKFHYDSIKQTQKWLALHEACSPARTDPQTLEIYDTAFAEAVKRLPGERVHVIGLGCGGGQKDTRLLDLLKIANKEAWYSPIDVSSAMVLVARQTAARAVGPDHCFPLVCDLALAEDLDRCIDQNVALRDIPRVITFFGMLPNFEPQEILPRLRSFLRPGDRLLFSANLAPGKDYLAGMIKILPQYNNQLTREWLMTFLFDLGVEPRDGELRFDIQGVNQGEVELQRIVANFAFARAITLKVLHKEFRFAQGDSVRLFFSYRHTPELISKLFESAGISVGSNWLSGSGEEGVFEARRT